MGGCVEETLEQNMENVKKLELTLSFLDLHCVHPYRLLEWVRRTGGVLSGSAAESDSVGNGCGLLITYVIRIDSSV